MVLTNVGLALTSSPALLGVIPRVEKRVATAVQVPTGAGKVLHLEYADSLGTAGPWFSLSNMTLTSAPQCCFDFSQPRPVQRFYRAWEPNSPKPTMDVGMATEVLLAGAMGSSVWIDYINQFGPTNAWQTFDA